MQRKCHHDSNGFTLEMASLWRGRVIRPSSFVLSSRLVGKLGMFVDIEVQRVRRAINCFRLRGLRLGQCARAECKGDRAAKVAILAMEMIFMVRG